MYKRQLQDATASLVLANNVDKTELKELLNIAMERQTNQEKWNALAVKVPEFPFKIRWSDGATMTLAFGLSFFM